MPFNPRREKKPQPPPVVITIEQIAEAVERAADLRRQVAVRAEDVRVVTMMPSDAIQSTLNFRARSWAHQRQHRHGSEDRWWWIGWVCQESTRIVPDEFGSTEFLRTWEVWLNVVDDRVWLKPQ